MKENIQKQVEVSKQIELVVHEVEDNSVIVNIDGWRMRVYFDRDAKKDKYNLNQTIVVNYFGDIKDVHSIRFGKLK